MEKALNWKDELAARIPEELGREIDIFEQQMELRKQGKIDEKVFAETRLRRGIYGQRLYIDPVAEMVIAKFSSHPVAANVNLLPVTDPGFQAIALHLMDQA